MEELKAQKTISTEYPTKIWNKVFISIFIANMALYLGQQMVTSLVAKYADFLGASATMVGLVVSIFAVTALVFKIVSGPAIDTYNRKYILMGAMFVMTIAYLGYSFSKTIPMLLVFRLLQGSAQAFSATVCLTLAADALPPDKFGAGIGYFSLAQVASQAIGPTVGLALMNTIGYQYTFLVGAAIMVCAIGIASQIKIHHVQVKKFKINVHNIIAKEVLLPATVIMILAIAFSVINSFLIIFAGRQGVTGNIGLFFTVYALTLLFTRPFIGKMTDKFGLVKVSIPAVLCTALSFVIISYSKSLPMFLIAAFVSAFGYGACQPAIQSLSMKCVSKDRRGAASSTNYIGNDLGNLIGPVIAGAVIERVSYIAMWRWMTIPILIAMLMIFVTRRRINTIEHDFALNYGESK